MAVNKRMWEKQQERKRRERERRARLRRNCTIAVLLAVAVVVAVVIVVKGNPAVNTSSLKAQETEIPAVSAITQPPAPSVMPTTPVSKVSKNKDAENIKLSDSYFENAVFIGDALAEGIGMYGILPECAVYARIGLAVDSVYSTAADNDTVAIIDQLKSKKYSKVFLAFGENEIMSSNVSDFKNSYGELIGKVKDYQSGARIYLMALPPVSKTASERYGITESDIRDFNAAIKELAAKRSVYYSDSFNGLVERDGFLPEGISADGINLNKVSYLKMLDYITTHSYIPGEDEDFYEDNIDDEDDSDDSESNSRDYEDEGEDNSSRYGNGSEKPKPTVNVLKDSHSATPQPKPAKRSYSGDR